MSWDAWCDGLVKAAPGVITKAALIGLDSSVWGTSPKDLPITQPEVDKLVGNLSSGDKTRSEGITLAGTKYMVTKYDLEEGRAVHGRKGADGVVIVKCATVLVVAIYKDDARHASTAAEKLADKLVAMNY